jgi:hypothetical protein
MSAEPAALLGLARTYWTATGVGLRRLSKRCGHDRLFNRLAVGGGCTPETAVHLLSWLPVKKRLPPGKVHQWLVEEFDSAAETARKAIQAAEVFGDRIRADLLIDASALYVLSRNYVSDAIRTQVIERAKAGERITHRTVAAMVRKATGKGCRG